jgi:membrane protein YdbS with pleckstrin-like domain
MEIRQSIKAVKAGYILCLLLELAVLVLWYTQQLPIPVEAAALLPVLLAVFVVIRHIQRRMTKITITSDLLHYEAGMVSKATRTVELAKVQDVRVNMTLAQRVFNIGNVSLETAGSSSKIIMDSIDRPQEVANHILDMARQAGRAAQFGPLIPDGKAKVNELDQGA